MKSIARQVVWPLLRPVWRKGWARLEMRIAPIEGRLASLESFRTGAESFRNDLEHFNAELNTFGSRLTALEGAWRQNIPQFLNAIATVPAFGHELLEIRHLIDGIATREEHAGAIAQELRDQLEEVVGQLEKVEGQHERLDLTGRQLHERIEHAVARHDSSETLTQALQERMDQTSVRQDNADTSIGALWDRIEFVRREILFEMAHGRGAMPQPAEEESVTAKVLSPEKVGTAQLNGTLRLNLGCGHIALPDYVNVDMRELPGVDVVAEVGHLPFEPGSVHEIYSAHLLEHFPQEAMRRRLLPYWHSLLHPGGIFRAITPDAAAMLADATEGSYCFDDFREVVFGSQDYDGDYHYNLFTPDSLRDLLGQAGFQQIETPVTGRRNGKCFEFEISARRLP